MSGLQFNNTLFAMRILCPAMFAVCVGAGYFSYQNSLVLLFGINCFLAAVNLMLTWFEWTVLQPRRSHV